MVYIIGIVLKLIGKKFSVVFSFEEFVRGYGPWWGKVGTSDRHLQVNTIVFDSTLELL